MRLDLEVQALLVQPEQEVDLIQVRVLLTATIKVNAVELEGPTGMNLLTVLRFRMTAYNDDTTQLALIISMKKTLRSQNMIPDLIRSIVIYSCVSFTHTNNI